MSDRKAPALWNREIVSRASIDSFVKLDPRVMIKNPVMFVVEVTSVLVMFTLFRDLLAHKMALAGFEFQIALWLWFTVLFANFAEAMAEGRGKAQAENLRKTRTETQAKLITASGETKLVPAAQLRRDDVVMVAAGDVIPGDGEVIEGIAAVNEAAITGESAPVIRESGGDRSGVTGGTTVISDWIKVKITANPGETFLDRMIALVEGAQRQKTPNEIALSILLSGLTIVFLLVVVTLYPFGLYGGTKLALPVLVALLVCLIPTTIGGLLSAIGIAGMDRLVQHNVLAMSGRSVEAAGDVDTLLLDKTGTITLGNRMAAEFIPVAGVEPLELAEAAQLSSLADETPEGRSIVVLAKREFNLRGRELGEDGATFIPFSAQTRMSGVDIGGRRIRKGAAEQVANFVKENHGAAADRLAGDRRTDRAQRRNSAGGRRRIESARRDLSERHGQGRNPRALRAPARHGFAHRHDYRRQPADGGRDRQGIGRR